jgi:hypothetical protein
VIITPHPASHPLLASSITSRDTRWTEAFSRADVFSSGFQPNRPPQYEYTVRSSTERFLGLPPRRLMHGDAMLTYTVMSHRKHITLTLQRPNG